MNNIKVITLKSNREYNITQGINTKDIFIKKIVKPGYNNNNNNNNNNNISLKINKIDQIDQIIKKDKKDKKVKNIKKVKRLKKKYKFKEDIYKVPIINLSNKDKELEKELIKYAKSILLDEITPEQIKQLVKIKPKSLIEMNKIDQYFGITTIMDLIKIIKKFIL